MSKARQRIVSAYSAGKQAARDAKKRAAKIVGPSWSARGNRREIVREIRNESLKTISKHFRGPYYAGFCSGMKEVL